MAKLLLHVTYDENFREEAVHKLWQLRPSEPLAVHPQLLSKLADLNISKTHSQFRTRNTPQSRKSMTRNGHTASKKAQEASATSASPFFGLQKARKNRTSAQAPTAQDDSMSASIKQSYIRSSFTPTSEQSAQAEHETGATDSQPDAIASLKAYMDSTTSLKMNLTSMVISHVQAEAQIKDELIAVRKIQAFDAVVHRSMASRSELLSLQEYMIGDKINAEKALDEQITALSDRLKAAEVKLSAKSVLEEQTTSLLNRVEVLEEKLNAQSTNHVDSIATNDHDQTAVQSPATYPAFIYSEQEQTATPEKALIELATRVEILEKTTDMSVASMMRRICKLVEASESETARLQYERRIRAVPDSSTAFGLTISETDEKISKLVEADLKFDRGAVNRFLGMLKKHCGKVTNV